MPHHVYANNNEIATKSSDGKSAACFPDVCFSPPTPPATGVPIPYANTCFAKDITNGSKTVIIGGAEVALENHSYFKSSVGDAPATKALKKGIRSGNVNGKGFFQTWSQNVKVEGKGVCRHMDLVTHNHTNSGNTVPNKFISLAASKNHCAEDVKSIIKNCKEKKDSERKRDRKKKNNFLSLIQNIPSMMDDGAKKAYGYNRNKNNSWVDDYCDSLWVKPQKGANGQLDKLKKKMEDLLSLGHVGIMKQTFVQLISLAYQKVGLMYLVKEIGILGIKAVVKNIVGVAAGTTGIGLTVTAGMAAWTVSDIVSSAKKLAKVLNTKEANQLLKMITNPRETYSQLQKQLKNYKDNPVKFVADMMSAKANTSPCIKSRRCLLVPYNQTGAAKAAKSGKGCCPGQTGHHIMPKAMLDGKCAGYKYLPAPTMCLEGATQNHGSHGTAHTALDNLIDEYKDKTREPTISYAKARDLSIEAIKKVALHCDVKCLKAQLDEHHAICKGKRLNATAGK